MNEKKLIMPVNTTIIENPLRGGENSLKDQMVAMGTLLAKAHKALSKTEYKLLIMCLTKINWSKTENKNEVELDKKEISEILGIAQDSSMSAELRKMFMELMKHSMISWEDPTDKEIYEDGFLITNRRSTRGSIVVKFNPDYMPLLENLLKDKDFITIWANDIYNFDSKYSYLLFEELRLHCDTTKTNYRVYSTRQLKELFGIPKDGKGSYMHDVPNKKTGEKVSTFDRSNFEKYVLDVAIKEINEGQMVQILPSLESKGKCYIKVKKNGYIVGYQFKYYVRTKVVDAIECNDEQLERQMNLSDYGL